MRLFLPSLCYDYVDQADNAAAASASSANFHVSQTYSATLRVIIGGALGALLLVALIVAFLWARIRCRRRLRRARAVPMYLTDKGCSASLQTYLSSTTRGLRPLPSSIPRAVDDFSTAPTPPASCFSRPPSGVASMPKSRKHAARLRLSEKLSTPYVGRARVEGTTCDIYDIMLYFSTEKHPLSSTRL